MPTIRITDEVANELKKLAVPLEDTWDSVLRRVLGIDSSNGRRPSEELGGPQSDIFVEGREITHEDPPRRRRRRRGDITPAGAFREPILDILTFRDGRAERADMMDELEGQIGDSLTEADREPRADGTPLWKNTADWMRKRLVDEGVLRNDSDRGIWELALQLQKRPLSPSS